MKWENRWPVVPCLWRTPLALTETWHKLCKSHSAFLLGKRYKSMQATRLLINVPFRRTNQQHLRETTRWNLFPPKKQQAWQKWEKCPSSLTQPTGEIKPGRCLHQQSKDTVTAANKRPHFLQVFCHAKPKSNEPPAPVIAPVLLFPSCIFWCLKEITADSQLVVLEQNLHVCWAPTKQRNLGGKKKEEEKKMADHWRIRATQNP